MSLLMQERNSKISTETGSVTRPKANSLEEFKSTGGYSDNSREQTAFDPTEQYNSAA